MNTPNGTPSPNHPAVKIISALESETMRVERAECAAAGMPASDHPVVQRAARVLDAARSKSATTSAYLSILTALSHLTADDLPARLVRDIRVQAIRDAARAATYDAGGIPGDHCWNPNTVAEYLDGLADNIESDDDA